MKITVDDKFWVVRNPTNLSVIEDVLFQCTIETLGYYLAGSNAINRTATKENLTIHTNAITAREDAEARLAGRGG